MGSIHVNTDLMRQLGTLFVQLNEQIENQLEPQIQHTVAQLEGDWLGVSRQHFDTLLMQWRASVISLTNWGESIGRHLQETASRFEQADQSL